MAQAGEGIGEEAVASASEEGSVGSEERKFEVVGEIDEEAIAALLSADVVASESEVDVVLAKCVAEPGGAL